MEPKKILITGCSGLIGTALTRKCLEWGCEVDGIDLRYPLKNLMANPNFNFHQYDVRYFVFPQKYDIIFNLACDASPKIYQNNPEFTFSTCVDGIRNLISQAGRTHIVHASTSEIYGCANTNPQNEQYFGNVNVWGPRSCYDEGKRAAETICYLANLGGSIISVARIFNTYGPGAREGDGRVITNFLDSARGGEPLRIYGDGTQTRSFMFVDDCVRGLVALANSEVYSPTNIGNPEEISILQLAEKILEISGSKSSVVFEDRAQDDPIQRRPDITKAWRRLGWKPKIMLEEGLKEMLK